LGAAGALVGSGAAHAASTKTRTSRANNINFRADILLLLEIESYTIGQSKIKCSAIASPPCLKKKLGKVFWGKMDEVKKDGESGLGRF